MHDGRVEVVVAVLEPHVLGLQDGHQRGRVADDHEEHKEVGGAKDAAAARGGDGQLEEERAGEQADADRLLGFFCFVLFCFVCL